MKKYLLTLTLLCLFCHTLSAQDFEQKACDARVVSGNGDAPATVVFRNTTTENLKLYWVNFEGKAESYGDIGPREDFEQPTFVGHYFMIADQNNNCLGKFAALSGKKVIIPVGKAKTTTGPDFLLYNTSAERSEQLEAGGKAPQVIASYRAGQLYIAWNDLKNKKVKVSAFTKKGNAFENQWTQNVPNGLNMLAGFTTDGTDLYCMTAVSETISDDDKTEAYRPNILNLVKLNARGERIWVKDLNTPQALGSAIFSPTDFGSADLVSGNGKLALISAVMGSPDANGYRHQGALYMVLDAQSGNGNKEHRGGTSWRHSFNQRILFDGKDFVILDLADAGWFMPAAGLTLNKIVMNNNSIKMPDNPEGIYVYARQGETAGNQNYTFTSMGDIAVGQDGYTVLFSSEKSNPGKTRSGWTDPILEPRNVGIVHVVKNFEQVKDSQASGGDMTEGKQVGNTHVDYAEGLITLINITTNIVDTKKKNAKADAGGATFSRPDKPGLRFKTASVAWLTNFTGRQSFTSAERPKLIKLNQQQYLVLWEEWLVVPKPNAETNPVYQSTRAMIVDEYGNVVAPPKAIQARLNPGGADKPFLMDGKAAWLVGENNQWKLCTVDANLNLEVIGLDIL